MRAGGYPPFGVCLCELRSGCAAFAQLVEPFAIA